MSNQSREALEIVHGQGKVYDTKQVQRLFQITGFLAPYVSCIRKSDGVRGTLKFQHSPRFYFGFLPE